MAVNIVFGKTDKRINSTKQTFSGNTKTISCSLREPCSMQNPIFRFMLDTGTDAGFYNYCSWGSYYYWIDDIIYLSNDIIEVHCHLDPLATYKSSIKNTHGFAVYSNADNKSVNIDDTRLQPEMGPAMLRHTYSCSIFKNKNSQGQESGIDCSNSGCVLMTFTQTNSVDWINNLSPHDNSSGTVITPNGIHTAVLTWSQFRSCFADLNDFGSNIVPSTLPQTMGDACLEIIQAFARAIQTTSGSSLLDNVQRAIWVPLDYTDLINATGAVKRYGLMLGGALASNVEWYEIPSTLVLQFQNYIELVDNDHKLLPANNSNLSFLLNSRFSSLQIVTPGGYSEVGTDCLLYGGTKLHMISSLSVASGEWSLKISKQSDFRDCLASFAGSIGFNLKGTISAVPSASMQLAKAGANFVGAAVGMGVGAIVGGITAGEGMYVNGIKDQMKFQHYGSETKAISSGIQHMVPQTNFNSDLPSGDFGGGASGLFLSPTAGTMSIQYICFVPYLCSSVGGVSQYEQYCNQYGYPCNKYLSLSGYSGFVQMSGASVEPDASGNGNQMSEASKSTINSYLNSGIYIE